MATAATKGAGTLFQAGDGSTQFTTYAEVTAVNGPGLTRETYNATYMESTWQEYIGALPDGGEVSIDLNWLPAVATHAQMLSDLSAVQRNYRVRWPNFGATTQTFTTNFAVDEQLDAAAHGMETGAPFQCTTSGTLPAGLSLATTYYCRRLTAGTLTAHATSAGAAADTGTIDITDDGTGTHTLQMVTSWSFAALITNLTPTAPVDGKLSATASFKVTAAPTFT